MVLTFFDQHDKIDWMSLYSTLESLLRDIHAFDALPNKPKTTIAHSPDRLKELVDQWTFFYNTQVEYSPFVCADPEDEEVHVERQKPDKTLKLEHEYSFSRNIEVFPCREYLAALRLNLDATYKPYTEDKGLMINDKTLETVHLHPGSLSRTYTGFRTRVKCLVSYESWLRTKLAKLRREFPHLGNQGMPRAGQYLDLDEVSREITYKETEIEGIFAGFPSAPKSILYYDWISGEQLIRWADRITLNRDAGGFISGHYPTLYNRILDTLSAA